MKETDLESAASICRENGLAQPSRMMKQLASGKIKGYMVLERTAAYGDDIFYLQSGSGNPENIYMTKRAAKKALQLESARVLRKHSPFAFGYSPKDVLSVSTTDFESKVSKILGSEFHVPTDEDLWNLDPIFPKYATDEQLLKISKMIKIEFYEVIEVELER